MITEDEKTEISNRIAEAIYIFEFDGISKASKVIAGRAMTRKIRTMGDGVYQRLPGSPERVMGIPLITDPRIADDYLGIE